jgi:long-chain fatty acid transport protein
MNSMRKNTIAGAMGVMVSLLLVSTTAHATNGYFSHGYGTKSKGVAGAGVATVGDAMDGALNPATMVLGGQQFSLGLAWFSPMRSYSVSGMPTGAQGTFGLVPGKFDSDNENFFVPGFGVNWMRGEDSAFGLTVYGNGGMNTDWKGVDIGGGMGAFGAGDAGVDLMQLFVNGTYSRKFDSGKGAWGVSAILAAQSFEAYGLRNFAGYSNNPNKLSDQGADTAMGYGFKVGFQNQISSRLALGASYQSPIWMGEFEKYSGLFAEEGGFDVPQTVTAGFAFNVTQQTKLLADLQWINYSGVASIGNSMMPALGMCGMRQTASSPYCLGGSDGAGFGWEDMLILKLGIEIDGGKGWTWRLGGSMADSQPIPESEVMFNILAPGVMETHVTAGFSKALSDTSSIDFAVMYAPSNSVSGPNPLEAPGRQTIELQMEQIEVAIQYNKRF